jgi:GT2 family glycosyltransferase
MKKVLYISDLFVEEILGGAELADDVIIQYLGSHFELEKIHSEDVTHETLIENQDSFFIISNFMRLKKEIKQELKDFKYCIIEHDHKFLKTRDPSRFKENMAPADQIKEGYFYRNAQTVFCQSFSHACCLRDNLILDNVSNFGFSFWSKENLDLIEELLHVDKTCKHAIVQSNNPIKGTLSAVTYCEKNKIKFNLISSDEYSEFIKKLAQVESLIFFPQIQESFCRLAVEARMLGCALKTNNKLGCLSENWFGDMKGQQLIDFARKEISRNLNNIKRIINGEENNILIEPKAYPKISIITSLFKGEKYIENFLKNITNQTVFEFCELLIVDADSPENEYSVIEKYMQQHSNIYYERLSENNGIYAAWNVAIKRATGKYLTNANLDDIRAPDQIEILVNCLEKNENIDLAYNQTYITDIPNETFEDNSADGRTYPLGDFSKEAMIKCLPGCMPVWRKSMQDSMGFFDDSYRHAGDWEMWLRAVKKGSKFKRVNGIHGLYFANPDGISTCEDTALPKYSEEKKVFWEYADIFGSHMVNQFREYFSK